MTTNRTTFLIVGFMIVNCSALHQFKRRRSPTAIPLHQKHRILLHGEFDVHFTEATKEEFWDDGPIDIYEAFDQHSYKTLDTCNNICHADNPVCSATSKNEFNGLTEKDLIVPKPFLARGQYVFEWEKKYLSYPPLTDTKTLPDLELSKVTVENTRQGVVRCKILETIHGRLDVVDGYGRQRTKGDDVVRVWMKGSNPTGYAVVGDVLDLKNGSYVFSVKCLWTGLSSLHVAIAYPREFIRTFIHQIHIGATRFMTATFKNGNYNEDTICFQTPNIPGWECICNFSKFGYENYYCGRPRTNHLTCDDWINGGYLSVPTPHDVTGAERSLIKSIATIPQQRTVAHNFKISTENTGNVFPELQPCHMSNKNVTWTTAMPKGIWTPGNIWKSLVCKDVGVINTDWTLNCLRNTSVWIFGDSNARFTYDMILALTKCNKTEGGYPLRGTCIKPETGLTINVFCHEGPVYTYSQRSDNFTVPNFIQKLPKNQKHILIIQYYLHYTASHLAVLSLRMKSLRAAIEKLLEENPIVLIGLRGPHIASLYYNYNHAVGGDPLGPQYIHIIRDRFKGLEDKIVFLDLWEMSIGIENFDYHPPQYANLEMFKFLLSFQCN
ncbi:NXPE family member 2-like [Physella acuta]|uniref:NXPE family member 2-like n=1 Tax=Physella acuta TaxID=109671 RepID=UPI0027DB48D0|nr:NXPE family member 2-like [Physella acuta]